MQMRNIISFTLLFVSISIYGQDILNLDFEKYSKNGSPLVWKVYGEGYKIFVDSVNGFSSKSSLCVKREGKGAYHSIQNNFPIDLAKGKTLTVTAYIKTKKISYGNADLWLQTYNRNKSLKYVSLSEKGPTGTSNWKKYSVTLRVDTTATEINFGVKLKGDGIAWFDKLQFKIDGRLLNKIEQKESADIKEQINWLKNNIDTFETADPNHDNSDLKFLKEIVGESRIVSLGEGTHGTSEFFKMKHRITKYLAEEMGFTLFAIEANMPEAKAVNDYILYGTGDPKKALAGLYFWTWNTQEVLEMIEWMREFNESKKGRIEFWGFDMQYPFIAMQNVQKFITENDSTYLPKMNLNYDRIKSTYKEYINKKRKEVLTYSKDDLELALEIFNHVFNKTADYQKYIEKNTVEWAIQNARIVVQSVECKMNGKTTRDESMAENVEWILNHSDKNTKIVLWAHNGHVSKGSRSTPYKTMGNYLNEKYGKEIIVFGFSFYEGVYTAVGKNGIDVYTTSLPQEDCLEWLFHKTMNNHFILDLRKFSNTPVEYLQKDRINFRSIGALAMEEAFYPTIISEEYDALIYFKKTTATECFNRIKK